LKLFPTVGANSSDSDGCGTPQLKDKSLYLYGFFNHMLTSPNSGFKPSKKNVNDVQKLQKNVVVVLDEFPALNDTNSQKLRLLRNVVRALGFKLVVMGTNSSAANLVRENEQSRGKGTFAWCYIFPRLPKFKLDVVVALNSTQTWIRDILSCSRPLFSTVAANYIQDLITGDINSFLAKVAHKAVDLKGIFIRRQSGRYGLHGQVCLFLNVSYSEYYKEEEDKYPPNPPSNPSLIHHHFAHLVETNVIKLDNNLNRESKKWEPVSRFPTPSEDFLLSACLMGSKDFYPFQMDGIKISFTKAADIFKNRVDTRRLQINYQNSAQTSNDGMFMEAILAGSLIVASRFNGVNGIHLHDFIPAVFAQVKLSDELLDFTLKDTENELLNDFMKSFWVPFVAPPNQKWPEFVKDIPNAKFGNLLRTVNKDKIDLNSDFGLTGEAKDHAKNISSDVMDGILSRIHDKNVTRTFNDQLTPKSKIHIVFVKSLMEREYFSSNSSKSFTSYKNYCCVKVEVDSQEKSLLHLRDISGLSKISDFKFNNDSTLVVFYELKANEMVELKEKETEQEVSNKRKQLEVPVGKVMKLKR
jgi:hypothetical protein